MYILGIEFGSTRIKAVLIDESSKVLATGIYEWENKFVDGLWTYSIDEVKNGLQKAYADLINNYGQKITKIDSIGISAMMHGYLAFDEQYNLLAPFRTWRNTNTSVASEKLSDLFKFNIPMRWSISHYYQAILNNEKHVAKVSHLTTLAGYVHYLLTGNNCLGIGDASGMFPVLNNDYNNDYINAFNNLLKNKHNLDINVLSLLPKIKLAGENAGHLTKQGALLLDSTGTLLEGSLLCPPEGDASTGMVATNSVLPKTANISAGTSAFLMVVLENELKNYYPEIDIVTTPLGKQVAMIHTNNFSSDFNKWFDLFNEIAIMVGGNITLSDLFNKSKESDFDVGQLSGYSFFAGEPIAKVDQTKLILKRETDSKMNVANLMQHLIYSSLGTIALGKKILDKENVVIDKVCGHGGFFKTPFIGQNAMSAALKAPVSVMENSGEGGAWGIAVLALYAIRNDVCFDSFMENIFLDSKTLTVMASEEEINKFNNYFEKFQNGLK